MATLEFVRIPSIEKKSFLPQFQAYLEEIDLISGRSINPDFNERFPSYDKYFQDDPNYIPFRIYLVEHNNNEQPERKNVGFFFLKITKANEIPQQIPRLFKNEEDTVAWLTDFYIFPNFRGKGLAWDFYYAIIELAHDPSNQWHVVWESDVNNKPAINFYEKVLERISKEFNYRFSKTRYTKKDNGHYDYYFYQIEFKYE